MIDYATGQSSFKKPMMITTREDMVAKLYDPWLRVEHEKSLLFIDPLVTKEHQSKMDTLVTELE